MSDQFDKQIDRNRFNTFKWQFMRQRFGRDDLIPMWVADGDLPTVPEVTAALVERAQHPFYGYTYLPASYRQAVSEWYSRRFSIQLEDHWLIDMPGGVAAVNFVFQTFLRPGDKVMMNTPVYHCFFEAIHTGGYTLVASPLRGDNFDIDLEDVEAGFKEGVKIYLLCSPHNPVGRVWSKETIQAILELSMKYQVLVLSDEIFCDLVFPDHTFTSALALDPKYREQLVVFSSTMKTFNLAGLHLGQLLVPDKKLREKLAPARYTFGNEMPNCFGMIGAEAAYRHGEPWLQSFLEYVSSNVKCLKEGTKHLPVSFRDPDATYLVWLNCKELNVPDLFRYFVDELRIAVIDGRRCGPEGEGYVRLNLACPRTTVESAVERLQQMVQ